MKNMGGLGTDISRYAKSSIFLDVIDNIDCINFRNVPSVSTVDTLYAAFPAFLYLNPDLGGYLLSPLLEYEDTSTSPYSVKNAGRSRVLYKHERYLPCVVYVGSAYPNATADQSAESEYGVEG